MISEQNFGELFYNTLADCIGEKKLRFSDIKPLYNDLKILDNLKLIQIIKLVNFLKNEMEMKYNFDVINTPNYFDTKLKSDIAALIKANRTNVKFLGYSPLIGNIFRYYIYITKFKQVKKFKELEQKLLQEWNNISSFRFNDNLNNKSVLFFFRLFCKVEQREPFKELKKINLREDKIIALKKSIESIYSRKIHSDTFYKLFLKILVENNIADSLLANKIVKQMFDYHIHINDDALNEKEVIYAFNSIKLHLKSFTGIVIPLKKI